MFTPYRFKSRRVPRVAVACTIFAFSTVTAAQVRAQHEPIFRIDKDLSYLSGTGNSAYSQEMCRADFYYPMQIRADPPKDFPLMIWFHSSDLTEGERDEDAALLRRMTMEGLAVVNVSYRYIPSAKFPEFIQDGAKAVAWAMAEGVKRGANYRGIFVGGKGGGGYIAAMLAVNPQYLLEAKINPLMIAGYVPVSANFITPFMIRASRGLKSTNYISDNMAPLYYVNRNVCPMLILVGDRDAPLALEEAKLFQAAMKTVHNEDTQLFVDPDKNHADMTEKFLSSADKAKPVFWEFIRVRTGKPDEPVAKPTPHPPIDLGLPVPPKKKKGPREIPLPR